MKKVNVPAAGLFMAAALVGSLLVGSGVFAQSASPVFCSPSVTSVPVGQSVTLAASGGNGNYMWSSPGLVITNPTGSNFTVAFNGIGTYPVTVTSAGMSATCSIAVTAATVTTTTTVPGLPNTGELPE